MTLGISPRRCAALLGSALLLICNPGCGGLQLQLHNASVQKPSNVALYFSVETRQGEPVGGLSAESFKIYEDEQLISPFESKQTILNPEESVIHFTLLLLDQSGSITESGSSEALVAAAGAFADRVTKFHQVGVYAFDGSDKLTQLAPFSSRAGAVHGSLSRTGRTARDPSTNLHGAVVQALQALTMQMSRATQSLRFGTLVVFTDGQDRAHRVSEREMLDALAGAPEINVFAIGLGPELTDQQLGRIGRSGYVRASDQAHVQNAFDEIAGRIERAARKYYLLSYCSPARSGTHTLRVEAHHGTERGSAVHEFNADGFTPNCDPNRKPNFPIGAARRAAPAAFRQ